MKILSKITTLLLVFVMLLAMMKNDVLYIFYQYNTSLFVSLFCENKDKPQMHCNGQCKLAKMFKEQQQNEANKVLKQLQTEALYFFKLAENTLQIPDKFNTNPVKHRFFYHRLYTFIYATKSYKPPQLGIS